MSDEVPELESDCNKKVHDALRADTMRGVRGLLPFLLKYLPITVYTGNFDLKVPCVTDSVSVAFTLYSIHALTAPSCVACLFACCVAGRYVGQRGAAGQSVGLG